MNKMEVVDSILDSNMEKGIDVALCMKLADDYNVRFDHVLLLAKQIYKIKLFNGELKGANNGND